LKTFLVGNHIQDHIFSMVWELPNWAIIFNSHKTTKNHFSSINQIYKNIFWSDSKTQNCFSKSRIWNNQSSGSWKK